MEKIRCRWCGTDPLYQAYHDEEWGVPVWDDTRLFEFLTLEAAQAGLSWITILRKREAYRQAYFGFDPAHLATLGAEQVELWLETPGIVRNRLKLEASLNNARRQLPVGLRRRPAFAAKPPGWIANLGPDGPRCGLQQGPQKTRLQVPGSGGHLRAHASLRHG